MDLKDNVQVFCSCGKGLTKANILVDWNEIYNMKHHSTFYSKIEDLWVKKSKSSIRLFDASKFRLHQIKMNRTDDSLPNIKFLLGTTSYKEFIGTNCAPFAKELVADGIADHSDPNSYLSSPVGVGGILETDDGDLVFIRRSDICAEMPGLLDRPGGHPEPDVTIPLIFFFIYFCSSWSFLSNFRDVMNSDLIETNFLKTFVLIIRKSFSDFKIKM